MDRAFMSDHDFTTPSSKTVVTANQSQSVNRFVMNDARVHVHKFINRVSGERKSLFSDRVKEV